MDDKTRNNFDLNIWNPQTMTDNRIYETCDDALGTENHYCTPVPSRDSGISSVRSTSGLTSGIPKSAFQRHGISGKTVGILLTFFLAILLVSVLLACSAFALSELQHLQVEMSSLKEELANFRYSSNNEVGNLTLAISREKQNREEQLNSFEDVVDSMLTGLTESTNRNISQLEFHLQSDLDVLRGVLSANLSAVANLTSAYYMNLTLALNTSFSTLSEEFDEFQSQYWNNYQIIQSSLDLHSSEIESTNTSLSLLQDLAEDSRQNLTLALSSSVGSVRQEVGILSSGLQERIESVQNETLVEVSKLRSDHGSDVGRIEHTLTQSVEILSSMIQQNENHILSNISNLTSYVNSNVFDLQSSLNTSRSTLMSEIIRVEYQLAAASHSNLTFLSSDFEATIETLENNVRENLTRLERSAHESISSSSAETRMELSKLEQGTQANLTKFISATQSDISEALNQSLTQISQLEANVLSNLSATSIQVSAAEQNFESQINTTLDTLESRTAQFRLELSSEISALRAEIRMNVTGLQVAIGDTRSSLQADLLETKQTLLVETASNITHIQTEINLRFQNTESIFWRNISSLESETQSEIEKAVNQTSLMLGILRLDLNLGITSVSQSAAHNISTLQMLMTGLIGELRLQTQRNLSSSEIELNRELVSMTSLLQHNLDSLHNTTDADIRELQRVDNRTLEIVGELELTVAGNLTQVRNTFRESLTGFSSDFQMELNSLNRTDSIILSLLGERELEIEKIVIHNNSTRMIITSIEGNIESLTRKVSKNQMNISAVAVGLNSIELSLHDLRIAMNDSYGELGLEIDFLFKESNQSFSRLYNITREISERLNLSVSEIKNDVVDQEHRANESIASLELRTNQSIRSLEEIFQDDIADLQSETYSNISKLDNDSKTMIVQVNASLVSEIEEASYQSRQKFTLLTERLASDVAELYNYANTSIESLNQTTEMLSLGLFNMSVVVSGNRASISELASNVSLARSDFMNSLQVATDEIHDTLQSVQSNISDNAESAKNLSILLERNFETNLSALQTEVFSSLEQQENQTLMVTNQLNSSISQLYMIISLQRTYLLSTLHQTEARLSTTLGNLSADTTAGFEQLNSSVSRNFSSVNMQLDTLSANASSAHSSLGQDLAAKGAMVNSSLIALGYTLNQLASSVARLEGNLSTVSSEVGQVSDSFHNFVNSPLSLYNGCMEETVGCSLVFDTPHYYTGKCTTDFRPVNSTVSGTIEVQRMSYCPG